LSTLVAASSTFAPAIATFLPKSPLWLLFIAALVSAFCLAALVSRGATLEPRAIFPAVPTAFAPSPVPPANKPKIDVGLSTNPLKEAASRKPSPICSASRLFSGLMLVPNANSMPPAAPLASPSAVSRGLKIAVATSFKSSFALYGILPSDFNTFSPTPVSSGSNLKEARSFSSLIRILTLSPNFSEKSIPIDSLFRPSKACGFFFLMASPSSAYVSNLIAISFLLLE